jgi:hypothetical protein
MLRLYRRRRTLLEHDLLGKPLHTFPDHAFVRLTREIVMRTIIFAFAAVAAASVLDIGAAQAQQYPWCLLTGPGPGDCSYSTRRECMASASGTGYECQRNYALRSSKAYGRYDRSRARYYGPQY